MVWLLENWKALAGAVGVLSVAIGAFVAWLRGLQAGAEAQRALQDRTFAATQAAVDKAAEAYRECVHEIDLAHPGDAGAHDRIMHKVELSEGKPVDHCPGYTGPERRRTK